MTIAFRKQLGIPRVGKWSMADIVKQTCEPRQYDQSAFLVVRFARSPFQGVPDQLDVAANYTIDRFSRQVHHSEGVTKPAVLCTMIDIVSQPQLAYATETLKLRRVDNSPLMRINIDKAMYRVSEFGCDRSCHGRIP